MVSRGIRAGFVAYTVWGLLTIYWKLLHEFDAVELIAWRVIGSAVVMVAVVTARRRWSTIRAAFADRQLTLRILAAALLLTCNWGAYVYAIVRDRIIETALGYFIAPLGTMALGIVVLKERATQGQKLAMLLATVSIAVMTVSYGRPPYIALIIAASWTLYGLLKRQIPLHAVEGLAAETFVLLLPAAAVAAALAGRFDSVPRSAEPGQLVLVTLAGVATVVPLALFAFAAPRVPFTILGPLNYLVPTIGFLLGWLLYHEDLPWSRVVGFTFVWAALVVVTTDRVRHSVAERRQMNAQLQAATPD
jgi:chloramphenicol-sensitive protein RarD